MTEPLLTVDEVAGLVKLDPEVVRRCIRDGELRASKLRGKFRVRPSAVDEWVDAMAVEPAAAPEPDRPRALSRPATPSSLRSRMEQHLPAA